MKIARIRAYRVALPLAGGRWNMFGGNSIDTLDSTIVLVETNTGLVGAGEACPLGNFYGPAYAAGVRAGIAELGPHLIGADPRETAKVEALMDTALKGHPYVKSALDIACWDILGQEARTPLSTLLGGRFGDSVALYRAISQDTPEVMARQVKALRAEGINRFQLKVGGDPDEDIARIRLAAKMLEPGDILDADANTGWLMHQAARVVRAVRDIDVYIEQPCFSYEENLSIRRRTDHPFVMDECIDSLSMLLRLHQDGGADVVNIKLGRVGGLTKARRMRDLCVHLGIPMIIEDTWGSDVATATIAHFAHSTPEALRFGVSDFNSYVTTVTADGAPRRQGAGIAATGAPGLGIRPRMDALGKPVVEIA
ncbi:MAG: cis-3-hydroxy-L-proline dehydratase [Alphaproteobacteria bacterium]